MDSVSRLNGGLFEAEKGLCREIMRDPAYHMEVVGLRDPFSDADLGAWSPISPAACPVWGPRAFGYSPEMLKTLDNSQSDLGYCPGLWKFPSLAAFRWACTHNRPMVVAPHGMLDGWALRNSRLRKIVAGWLYQNAQLRKAACLRALCQSEAESIRSYGLKNPICVIPNGVDLPVLQTQSQTSEKSPFGLAKPAGKSVLLYLGRLHPKKGIEILLASWRRHRADANSGSAAKDWILAIAGWGSKTYERLLQKQIDAAGSDGRILFLGAQFGEQKKACYQSCDAFILPSLSEGLPMAVLEAWSYCKPVLMTPQCNLPEGFVCNAAIPIHATSKSIYDGLGTLFQMSNTDRQNMGQRGFKLVSERFVWSKVAVQMRQVFDWAVGGGAKPSIAEFA
jgi:glycosyltransferase involved in cell wall biosynthesis